MHHLVCLTCLRPRSSTHLLGEGCRLRIMLLLRRKQLTRREKVFSSIEAESRMPERSSMPRPCHRPVLCQMLALVLSFNIKLGPLQVIIFIIVQITRIIISQWPMSSNCLCYLCYALCLPFALVFVSRII